MFFQSCSLPVPWLLFSLINGLQPVPVSSNGLFCAIVLLFLMLLFVISSIASCKWRMNKILGFTMFLLYFVFLIISVMLEDRIISCPVSVWGVTFADTGGGSEPVPEVSMSHWWKSEHDAGQWTEWPRPPTWMWSGTKLYPRKHSQLCRGCVPTPARAHSYHGKAEGSLEAEGFLIWALTGVWVGTGTAAEDKLHALSPWSFLKSCWPKDAHEVWNSPSWCPAHISLRYPLFSCSNVRFSQLSDHYRFSFGV